MTRVQVTVALADDADPSSVVNELRARGLDVVTRDDELGFVAGSCEEAVLDELRTVPGVASVERARHFQLPDPNGPS